MGRFPEPNYIRACATCDRYGDIEYSGSFLEDATSPYDGEWICDDCTLERLPSEIVRLNERHGTMLIWALIGLLVLVTGGMFTLF